MNYFKAGEILRSCLFIQPNNSKVNIILILVAEATFSTMASSEKVSTNKCDIDGQLEIASGRQTGNTNTVPLEL